jgi:hypothetical protein
LLKKKGGIKEYKMYLWIFFICILCLNCRIPVFDKIEKGNSKNLYYFDKNHFEGKTTLAHCNSLGLEYAGEITPDSSFFVCRGNITESALKYHAKYLTLPKKLRVSHRPVIKMTIPHEESSFQGTNDAMNLWHIPSVDSKSTRNRVAFHLNAYNLVSQGYTGKNAAITLIDSCFNIHNNDVHNLAQAENDINSSNNIEGSADGGDCSHGTEIWSLLTGRQLCTYGIVPEVTINARVIPIENNELTDIEFARSQHADYGQIIVRTFNPIGYNPLNGANVAYYDKTDLPSFAKDTVRAGARRGGIYFVSAGNYGNTYNMSSARACLDGSVSSEDAYMVIAATTPSGLAWYSNRGCIDFAAPGGDRTSCLSANSGYDCSCVAGTSFSAPLASSLAAVLQQICENKLTGYDIKDIFIRTSVSDSIMDSRNGYQFFTNGGGFNYSDAYGYGLINYQNAIDYVKKNNCPKVGPISSCISNVVVQESNISQIYTIPITAPSDCNLSNITFVRLYATLSWRMSALGMFRVFSPSNKVSCEITPIEHPYTQDNLDAVIGCKSFYGEPYIKNGTWSVRYNVKLNSYSRATFQLEFLGFSA